MVAISMKFGNRGKSGLQGQVAR